MAGRILVESFQVRECGLAFGTPVDHVRAAINEAAFVEEHEGFGHGAREVGVERETESAPIHAVADALHLFENAAAVLLAPLPRAFLELFASDVMASESLLG